jgi:hypothetical protein
MEVNILVFAFLITHALLLLDILVNQAPHQKQQHLPPKQHNHHH